MDAIVSPESHRCALNLFINPVAAGQRQRCDCACFSGRRREQLLSRQRFNPGWRYGAMGLGRRLTQLDLRHSGITRWSLGFRGPIFRFFLAHIYQCRLILLLLHSSRLDDGWQRRGWGSNCHSHTHPERAHLCPARPGGNRVNRSRRTCSVAGQQRPSLYRPANRTGFDSQERHRRRDSFPQCRQPSRSAQFRLR